MLTEECVLLVVWVGEVGLGVGWLIMFSNVSKPRWETEFFLVFLSLFLGWFFSGEVMLHRILGRGQEDEDSSSSSSSSDEEYEPVKRTPTGTTPRLHRRGSLNAKQVSEAALMQRTRSRNTPLPHTFYHLSTLLNHSAQYYNNYTLVEYPKN